MRAPIADRFAAAVGELQDALARLERAPLASRGGVYAECIPLLLELRTLNRPPLPMREVQILIHEAGWHLRSLAGLSLVKGSNPGDHSGWASQSLQALAARCGGQVDG